MLCTNVPIEGFDELVVGNHEEVVVRDFLVGGLEGSEALDGHVVEWVGWLR